MGWLYLIIVLVSIIIGILMKSLVVENDKLFTIHAILFFALIIVSIIIKFEFEPDSWRFGSYIVFLFLPIFISWVFGSLYKPKNRK